MRVCLGGTFNIFHKGHKHLLDKAIETAGKNGFVFIGVSKGPLTNTKKFLNPYTTRINAIRQYLVAMGYNAKASITPITTIFGLAVDGEYDAIIVSPETKKNAMEINKKRVSFRKKPLKIVEVPYVLAEDNKPISSTRIYNNEIDTEGRVLSSN